MDDRDLAPLFALRLRTPRVELRLPTEDELAQLARVAEQGIHPPEEMPFLVPWTDAIGSPSFTADFVAYHRALRVRWTADDWELELGVWARGSPIGVQGLQGTGFASDRTVSSRSWLGQSFQREGYGTEMRAAVLELAFAGLGAVAAESGALERNIASARVSEKLGYEDAGQTIARPRGKPVRERRFRLTAERWGAMARPQVEITGLDAALALFGRPRNARASPADALRTPPHRSG
jgi:RimJ/RimL family protein N-acetyltransferase